MHSRTLRPKIVVAATEHRQLLAMAAGGSSVAAETLLDEMERAHIVPDAKLPTDTVRMGSRVQYRTSEGDLTEVTLVYPSEADISAGRVSVLTPVGAALIGLRVGQSITWLARDGKKHVLTVLSVIQLESVR
ncbi:nucleoside diphosphate kinase regulator [Devosia rhizoryzae]|uniref:Nucleoside diphosphate kinase regulator n=1 Tax=Devosia rhizoryzae TaxID=2774137 RepID=A0ABX7C3H6_9HYPH|nr:nucleoside diphosphate kinase regulator [Devosia rhizoryzae]QQR38297.1 nucleoside diphosphate kinase regulator [Devosia rhizoryzae]